VTKLAAQVACHPLGFVMAVSAAARELVDARTVGRASLQTWADGRVCLGGKKSGPQEYTNGPDYLTPDGALGLGPLHKSRSSRNAIDIVPLNQAFSSLVEVKNLISRRLHPRWSDFFFLEIQHFIAGFFGGGVVRGLESPSAQLTHERFTSRPPAYGLALVSENSSE
jgi:hypothetical protein